MSHAENKDTLEEAKLQSHGSQGLRYAIGRKGLGKTNSSLSAVTVHALRVSLKSNVKLNCGTEKVVDPAARRKVMTQDQVSQSRGGGCPGELALQADLQPPAGDSTQARALCASRCWEDAVLDTQDWDCCPGV